MRDSTKGKPFDIRFVMITTVRKLLRRGLARAERFVEPRSELSDQGADQHDLDQETRVFTSTYDELLHLWPRLVPNGVMIIDDYGYWAGARKAVEFSRGGPLSFSTSN